MRKIMLCVMFLFGMFAFAEKLTTDGKNNLNLLQGNWSNAEMVIKYSNKKWLLGFVDADEGYIWGEIKAYKNGALVRVSPVNKNNIFYFAWDTKYKTLVELDKELNIISKYSRKLTGPAG